MKIRCFAKINLSLDITGRRPDGYHTLDSIFQLISVYDILELTVTEGEGISLTCDNPELPCDERNLAFRAAEIFLRESGKKAKVTLALEKHIPSGAGMGGGSADAAGVLYGLNVLLGCGYSAEKLREMGVQLGADVPFFLMGGTALAQGIGEILTELRFWEGLPLVVLKGDAKISTPEAYRAADALIHPAHPDTKAMLEAIAAQDRHFLCRSCGNFMEAAVSCADVTHARQMLLAHEAQCAVMTGSGAAVFGIFETQAQAAACAAALRGTFPFVQACTTQERNFSTVDFSRNASGLA